MHATIEILRGELERLFTLDELTHLSTQLLGLDPEDVGGSSAKASFARALAERCHDDDRIEALVDVIVVSRREVDPRVRDVAALTLGSEIAPGKPIGPFTVQKKLVEAQSLAARFARTGPSHINELKPILRGIVEPLAALHKEQLVHGNLKLENVLVGRIPGQTGPQSVKVTLI